jgi:hypothetical protein
MRCILVLALPLEACRVVDIRRASWVHASLRPVEKHDDTIACGWLDTSVFHLEGRAMRQAEVGASKDPTRHSP